MFVVAMSTEASEMPRSRPLPAGRHGLSRAFVVSNQRERMLDATIQAASELGYARMHVEDIIKRAGVSRRTFYEQFANKHAAFLAAFDLAADMLMTAVRHAYERETTFERRVSAGFTAFLGALASAPDAARVCIVEALAAGPDAIERREAVTAAFAEAIESNAPDRPADDPLPPLTAETLVGGVYDIVFRRLCDGRAAELPALAADLTEITLLPYVGHERATAEAARLRAEGIGVAAASG
jgi:AcrR family transcriptional regulator